MATFAAELNCTDSGAVQRSQNKVQELTSVIVRRLPYLHRIALRWIGNTADAEDVVQDALVSAYTHIHQFRGEARMSTWLTSIVPTLRGRGYAGNHGNFTWAGKMKTSIGLPKSYPIRDPAPKRNAEERREQN